MKFEISNVSQFNRIFQKTFLADVLTTRSIKLNKFAQGDYHFYIPPEDEENK